MPASLRRVLPILLFAAYLLSYAFGQLTLAAAAWFALAFEVATAPRAAAEPEERLLRGNGAWRLLALLPLLVEQRVTPLYVAVVALGVWAARPPRRSAPSAASAPRVAELRLFSACDAVGAAWVLASILDLPLRASRLGQEILLLAASTFEFARLMAALVVRARLARLARR